MEKNNLGLYIIVFLIVANLVVFSQNDLINTSTLLADVRVEDSKSIGFNIDTDALHFGHVGQGLNARRRINISNNYGFPIKVKIIKEQNEMKNWLAFENELHLEPNKSEIVEIALSIPVNAKKGYYANLLTLKYYKI